MTSYGTVFVQDGFYSAEEANKQSEKERRGLSRYVNSAEETTGPVTFQKSQNIKTFTVSLHYFYDKYVLKNSLSSATNLIIDYTKDFSKISSEKKLIKNIVDTVAPYSGCIEAKKLRKRLIALERIHNTVGQDSIRFPLIQSK